MNDDMWYGGLRESATVLGDWAYGSDDNEHCEAETDRGMLCTRKPHAAGTRHFAGTGKHRVVAAWPGTHRPDAADLGSDGAS